jgi:hypothetical protein
MSNNLYFYEKFRKAPPEALKEIQGGRLQGYSDINPMWRIKVLTEQFGPVGVGWKYVVVDQFTHPAGEEVVVVVNINLFYKLKNGEWSEAIPGTGGSKLIVKESKGLYVDDEAFKKALTDAISVSCKALGIAADVYWNKDRTKYTGDTEAPASKPATKEDAEEIFNGKKEEPKKKYDSSSDERVITEAQRKRMFAISKGNKAIIDAVAEDAGFESSNEVTRNVYDEICEEIEKRANNLVAAAAGVSEDDIPF